MPNSSTIPAVGSTQATPTLYNNLVKDAVRLLSVAGSNLTISSGAITVDPDAGESHYQVDTQSAAATDDLDTINGGANGDVIALVSANAARVITLRSGVGNIVLKDSANIILDPTQATILRYDGTNWKPYGGSSGAFTSNLTNKSGATVDAGDVVVFDTDNDSAFETTTYQQDIRVCGVAKAAIPNNASGPVHTGPGQIVTVNCNTAAVARGQFLMSSTTAGKATAGSYYREAGMFAIALTSKSGGSNGTVQAMLLDNFRQALLGTSGWAAGGSTSTTSQKFTMATETWATVAGAALSSALVRIAGMGYGAVSGLAVRGDTGSAAGASTFRNKITYATDTSSTLSASGAATSFYRSGINFSTKGWIAGGQNTGGTRLNTTVKTTFSTDTESAGNAISAIRDHQGGVSDGTYCYIAGGTQVNTDRVDNATEAISNISGANLGTAADGYGFISFPAVAGYRMYNNGSGTVHSRVLTYATATDANNANNPTGNIVLGNCVTDGIGNGYIATPTVNNKLASSTGTYSTVASLTANTSGANFSFAAL